MSMLYFCPTPIGNMGDITIRTLETLKNVSAVYCEDTRHTGALLAHFGIEKPLVSCHEHNESARADEMVKRVLAGEDIAYASDAGMPCISDPGERIVRRFIEKKAPFTVLPGPSASLTALALSGMGTKDAVFTGFLERSGSDREAAITALAKRGGCTILYESPRRVADTCRDIADAIGDRPVCLVREISKLYEEAVHGTLCSIAERYAEVPPKGECVLIVAGTDETAPEADPREMAMRLLSDGKSVKDAVKRMSAVCGISRNECYTIAETVKKELGI